MKICFFTKHEINWGSSRERIGVYLDCLKKRGHSYRVISCIPNELSQIWISGRRRNRLFNIICSFWYGRVLKHIKLIWIMAIAKKFDMILIQKINLLPPLIRILKLRNRNVIFDFDDQCFWDLESVRSNKVGLVKKMDFWKRGLQHPAALRLYSHVIAGNKYLAGIAAAVQANDRIAIIPTPIDCKLYTPIEKKSQGVPIIIGWAGSGENHLRHLELLIKPLQELIKQYSINFKLVGAMRSDRIKNLFGFLDSKFISIDWVDSDELPRIIQSFDIGVMPLKDDDESRGKCAFKVLQYMASGIPVVISPVGVNKEIVDDGINGFLAGDASEWIKKLSSLIEDEELRKNFAQKGRKTAEEQYSLDKTSNAFMEIVERFKI